MRTANPEDLTLDETVEHLPQPNLLSSVAIKERTLTTVESVTTLAPEPVRHVNRRNAYYRIRKVCYCCGSQKTGPHHIIPRSEGGLPIFDNIVYLCPDCHDAVEGPSVGAWDRIESRKHEVQALRRPQPKIRLDYTDERIYEPRSRFEELQLKRRSQGYLEPNDAREYQFMLAEGFCRVPQFAWDRLSTWCLWMHPEFHAEAVVLRCKGGWWTPAAYRDASPGLKKIIATMPSNLVEWLKNGDGDVLQGSRSLAKPLGPVMLVTDTQRLQTENDCVKQSPPRRAFSHQRDATPQRRGPERRHIEIKESICTTGIDLHEQIEGKERLP